MDYTKKLNEVVTPQPKYFTITQQLTELDRVITDLENYVKNLKGSDELSSEVPSLQMSFEEFMRETPAILGEDIKRIIAITNELKEMI